jgi:predicted membrane protein
LLKLNRVKLQAKQIIEALFALHFKLLYPMKIRHCTFAILLVFCACSAQKEPHNEIASVEKKEKNQATKLVTST